MMNTNSGQIDRRSYLKTAGLATAGMAGLAGCTGGDSTGGDSDDDDGSDDSTSYGTLSTSVTDQPSAIGDFESLTVTIDGVWIKPDGGDGSEDDSETDDTDDDSVDDGNETDDESVDEDTETAETDDDSVDNGNETDDESMDDGNETDEESMDNGNETDDESMDGGNETAETDGDSESMEDDDEGDDAGRRYIEFDEPQDADLVQLQGSNTQLIDETDVEAQTYQFLQLDVSNTEGILTDGSDATVDTPGNAPLKFNASFEVRADERTRFVADFAPNRKGNNGYVIRPVATSTQVLYGDEEYDPEADDTADTDTDGNQTDDTADAGSDGNQTDDSEDTGSEQNGNDTQADGY